MRTGPVPAAERDPFPSASGQIRLHGAVQGPVDRALQWQLPLAQRPCHLTTDTELPSHQAERPVLGIKRVRHSAHVVDRGARRVYIPDDPPLQRVARAHLATVVRRGAGQVPGTPPG